MLYNLTKYYLSGAKEDKEEIVTMKFKDLLAAESWADHVSRDTKTDYVIIDISPVSLQSR